jgi:hypothetical protein
VGGTAVGSAGGSVAAGAGGSVAAGVAGAPHAASTWLNTRTNTTKIIFQLFIFYSFLSFGKRIFLLKSEQEEQ